MQHFTSIQLDALKEVSNIGAGNATTALATMLNKKIDMTVPSVNIIKLEELYNTASEEETIGIVVRILGDAPGNILLLCNIEGAKDIISNLMGQDYDPLSELGQSALCEIGNVVCTSYMNAMAQFTGLNLYPSVPCLAYDMLTAILATAFIESGQHDEYILDIETVFLDSNLKNLGTHFYFIPVPGSLDKILKSIGVI